MAQELDRNSLKTQAFLEKISILENQNADFRVEITVLSQRVQELTQENAELHDQLAPVEDVPQEENPEPAPE